jgi:hypothetical protein
MTDAERAKYQRWWLERSGLSLDELREIAVGLVLKVPNKSPNVREPLG